MASKPQIRDIDAGLSTIEERLAAQGRKLEEVGRRLKALRIETPSWGYANSGTRFKVFPQPGVPRSVEEKLADAAQVQRLTGVAPSVALHIPWDRVDDWVTLRHYAEGLGLTLGAINPNLFQDEAYKLGSLAHPDAAVRRRATPRTSRTGGARLGCASAWGRRRRCWWTSATTPRASTSSRSWPSCWARAGSAASTSMAANMATTI